MLYYRGRKIQQLICKHKVIYIASSEIIVITVIYQRNKIGKFLIHIHKSPNQLTLLLRDYHTLKD